MQAFDYTPILIVVVFFGLFFGLAGYMVKRSMDLEKEKLLRNPASNGANLASQPQTILKEEKEVVREVVKVRCKSCGTLNVETSSFCENCGAHL